MAAKLKNCSILLSTSTHNRCQAAFPQVPILQKSAHLPQQLLLLKISTFQQKRPILSCFSCVWRRRRIFSLTFLTNQMHTDVFTSRSCKELFFKWNTRLSAPAEPYIQYTITEVHIAFGEKWMAQMVRLNMAAKGMKVPPFSYKSLEVSLL